MVGKLTLFELHMDSPQFGTNEYDDVEAEAAETEEIDAPTGGLRVGRIAVVSVAVAVAATLLARRFAASDDQADIDIDGVDDETPIEVTQ